ISKLEVLVRLKISRLYFIASRSVICVSLTKEMLAAFCHDWRKMLRWPLVKLVSKVSPAGIAPPRSPGLSSGKVKHDDFRAKVPGAAPVWPVSAFFAVQPGASGTIGLVMPSYTL